MQGRLAPLTSLQFLILSTLVGGEQSGRAVRALIARHGVRRTAPAFYQMMARLERAKLVEGWYEQIIVGDQAVTERRYRLKPAGLRVWNETSAFYERTGAAARQRWSDA